VASPKIGFMEETLYSDGFYIHLSSMCTLLISPNAHTSYYSSFLFLPHSPNYSLNDLSKVALVKHASVGRRH
jgi:hypothetical protein